MMNLMASTLGEGFGFIESEKGSNGGTFDECETKEDELLEFCDSRVDGNNEMTIVKQSIEELTPNDEPLEPYTGMSFNSVDDAREFYSAYAKRIGFTVRTNRIRHSQKNRAIIARDYVCSREGFRAAKHIVRKDRVLPPRPVTREGCKAMIRVAVRDGGKWVVTKFVPGHNHNLMTQNKVLGQRSSMSEDEKDKKIKDLSNELEHERQRTTAIQDQLHMILKCLDEQAEYISVRVDNIVNNMRQIEFVGLDNSNHR